MPKTNTEKPIAQESPTVEMIENNSAPNYYANHIECRVSNEEVALSFALRKYSDPVNLAETVHRTYLSIPLFVRLTILLLKQLKQMVAMGLVPNKVLEDIANEFNGVGARSKDGKPE